MKGSLGTVPLHLVTGPLTLALWEGRTQEATELFNNNKAELNSSDVKGLLKEKSPIHCAVIIGDMENLRLLVVSIAQIEVGTEGWMGR